MELRNIQVGIQGSPNSFHDEVAKKHFGKHVEIIPFRSFRESIEALSTNRVDYTVMAMENSIAGKILPNYELILEYQAHVMAEIFQPIALHLVALPETSREEIRTIRSHPMALLQCTEFLASLPEVEVVEAGDTALCVKEIAESRLTSTGAIAGYGAAARYGMKILQENIHSNAHNYTRFWILTKGEIIPDKVNKASLSFCLQDKTGSLADVQFIIRSEGLNLSALQSVLRPDTPEVYRFYADVEFPHRTKFLRCVKALTPKCTELRILGEYQMSSKTFIHDKH